jgi:hypothetical protein
MDFYSLYVCCNLGMSELPTEHLYQMQLSSSLLEGKGEVSVYVYINNGRNLELSHYSLKTIRPDTVLELVPCNVLPVLPYRRM